MRFLGWRFVACYSALPLLLLATKPVVLSWGLVATLALFPLPVWKLTTLGRNALNDFLPTFFWTFQYAFLAVPAFMQVGHNRFPLGGSYSDPIIILACAGIILFQIAYIWFSRPRSVVPRRSEFVWAISSKRLFLLSLVAMSIVVVVNLLPGVSATQFESREGFNSAIEKVVGGGTTGTTVVSLLYRVPVLVALFASISEAREKRGGRYGPLTWSLAVASLWAYNPITTPRFLSAMLVFGAILALMAGRRVQRYQSLAALIVFSLLVVFPLADAFRNNDGRSSLDPDLVAAVEVDGEFDAFQQGVNGMHVANLQGPTWGRQILGAFASLVPRALWSDKPVQTGALVAQEFNYANHNLSMPLWAEAYFDLGLLGVMAIGSALGAMTGALSKRMKPYGPVAITIWIMSPLQFFVLRGSLLPALGMVEATLACVAFLMVRSPNTGLPASEFPSAEPQQLPIDGP